MPSARILEEKSAKTAPHVVGLDISLNAPGICIATGDPRADVGDGLEVESASITVGKELRGPNRLSVVSNAVMSWMASRGVISAGTLVVTEGYAFSRQQAHSLGEIGGCIRVQLYQLGCNLMVIPPSTLKKFVTGKGAGDKNVIMKAALRRWGYDVDDDNQTDAFCCAVLGLISKLPAEDWTAVELDILAKKVERYAGQGQDWGDTLDETKASRGPRRLPRGRGRSAVGAQRQTR